jgi:hypothetical protein
MTYQEFRRQLGKAGLSVRAFAGIMSVRPNSVTNYAKEGHVPSHMAVAATLMAAMKENGLNFENALSKVEIKKTKRSRQASFAQDQASLFDSIR